MRNISARLILTSAFAMALAACASDDKKDVDPNIFPTNYKQEILDTLSRTLSDPTNIRGAFISDPVLAAGSKDQRYTVCVRASDRNAKQQYTGSTDRIAYFYAGHLNQLVEANKEQCAKAAYKPFPELEKLCLGKTCN